MDAEAKEQYRRLGEMLGKEPEIGSVLVQMHRSRAAEAAFLAALLQDPALQPILAEHKQTENSLRELYRGLVASAAGRWRGEDYLPVASLAEPESLQFILQFAAQNKGMSAEHWERLARIILTGFFDHA